MMHYRLGEIEHHDPEQWGRRPIFERHGEARWHALVTQAQREDEAEQWLHLRGVYAFHPIRRKATRLRGKVIERKKRYLPGYVFAHFPGPAIRHRVLDCPFIASAVTMQSGEWGILRPADLRKLYAMRDLDRAQEADRRAERKRARRIRPGDRVRILSGLWYEGQETEVIDVQGGMAVVRVHMLGGERAATADVAKLRKIV